MKFSDEQIADVFQLLAAILHIGNLEFITAGGAQVSNSDGELLFKLLRYQLIGQFYLE